MTRYEPTSHEYLYEMDREQLFALFMSVVAVLDSETGVVNCVGAQREGTMRIARAAQERTAYDRTPLGDAINRLASLTRIVVHANPSDERYDTYLEAFYESRAACDDMLPATPNTVAMPNDLASVNAQRAQLDPGDEVSQGADIPTVEGGYLWSDGRAPEPLAAVIEAVARAMNRVDKQRNPTWGGADAWEQLAQCKRDDYLAMAEAAVAALCGVLEPLP